MGCDILWSSKRFGEGFFDGEIIGSVEGVDEEVGDEFELGKRTPSNAMPLSSNLTTSWGSPVDEFSAD